MSITLCHNQAVLGTLANLSAGGRLPHAILLEGTQGLGKHTLARHIASLALCEGEQKPCGRCTHCVKVEKGIHPDLHLWGVPEGKKEFPVEVVRELRQQAYISPNEGNCKVYLLEQAHMMNLAAQNALLKLIEEPPPFLRFVLLCENRERMLPTILSRVTVFTLALPSVQACAEALVTRFPDRDRSLLLAAAEGAGGNVGQAIALLETAKPSKAAADAKKLGELLLFGDRYAALKLLSGYDRDREGLGRMLTLLSEQLARYATDRYRPDLEADARVTNRITPMQAVRAAQAVEQAQLRAKQNVSIPLLSACMLEQMKATLS